jgi:glyoxylase-like metal-dependent hydrolase (beta-lactamase superfamily II)
MGLAPGYLAETPEGLVLVDAGSIHQETQIMGATQRLGRDDLHLIFITHAHLDHYGSAAALRELTGAPIAVHRLDGEPMTEGESPIGSAHKWQGQALQIVMGTLGPMLRPRPTRPDVLLEDGDDLRPFGLNATVVHTPGHTFGSATLLLEGQVAFVGDLLSNTGYPHVQQYLAQDWTALQRSVQLVQALRPEWTYTGHSHKPLSLPEVQRLHP